MSLEKVVEKFKSSLQYLVGAYIFLFLIIKAWSFIGLPTVSIEGYQIIRYVLSTSILALVSQAVMVSAAIELAYMLFTPGPDEAVDPLILGIAGTALLVMSDENSAKTDSMLYDSIAVFLFAVSLVILFYLRFMLTKWFPKQFKDNFDKGSLESEATKVESIQSKNKIEESKSAA